MNVLTKGLAAGVVALVLAAPQTSVYADNNFEIGGFFGAHFYSEHNELGVADVPDANSLENTFIGGVRVGYSFMNGYIQAEGELGFSPSLAREGNADVLVFAYRAHPIFYFNTMDKRWRPFALAGVGGMYGSSNNDSVIQDDNDFYFYGGAGLKVRIEKNWGVRVEARTLFPPGSGTGSLAMDFEVLAGLYKTFQGGVEEEKKEEEPEDPDSDGIVGDADKCPTEAEDMDGFEDEDGCPDSDNDGDGILDANDKCKDKPESKNGIDDEDGCPEEDTDGDGLLGSQDKCPDKAEDKDGFEDEDGCPDIDNDGDGVPDAQDQCQGEKETPNGYKDEDGCPDELPKEVKRFSGVIKGIRFATGKALIRPSSYGTLNSAVKVLKKYPDLKMEIQGHTDNVGGDKKNKELSEERAKAVMEYLVSKGIGEDRLSSHGYGPEKPVADNKTAKGRAQNRRVEFKLISQLTAPKPEEEEKPAEEKKGEGDAAKAVEKKTAPAEKKAAPAKP